MNPSLISSNIKVNGYWYSLLKAKCYFYCKLINLHCFLYTGLGDTMDTRFSIDYRNEEK